MTDPLKPKIDLFSICLVGFLLIIILLMIFTVIQQRQINHLRTRIEFANDTCILLSHLQEDHYKALKAGWNFTYSGKTLQTMDWWKAKWDTQLKEWSK